MRQKLLLLVVFAALTSGLSGAASARTAVATGRFHFDKCPTAAEARAVDGAHYVQLGEAASGVQNRIPAVFRSAAAGGAFGYQMDSGYRMGIGSLYFANASKFCGVPIAQSSWAFSVSLPTDASPTRVSFIAFAAKSNGGWRVYGGLQIG
jgi:hypothetical protein